MYGHYLFRDANSFPRAKLEANCEHQGTENVHGQTYEHISAPIGGYCVYYPSSIFQRAEKFLRTDYRLWRGIFTFQGFRHDFMNKL